MNIGAVYVLVGERDERMMKQSIDCLRHYAGDIPITIYTDHRLPPMSPITIVPFDRLRYAEREENRNSSYWRLAALRESSHEVTAYIDNDVYPVSHHFMEGFEIANNYGLTLVENPRSFIDTEVRIGLDVSDYDRQSLMTMPKHMMALNAGLMFYHKRSEEFLSKWEEEQYDHPSRGQMSLVRAMWATKTAPYALPVNWLVCRSHCGIENPIALHCGHENIMAWWERDFKKKLTKRTFYL